MTASASHDDIRQPRAPRLILASASPRRRELLAEAGYAFTVRASGVDEEAPRATRGPADLAEQLSFAKAQAVARELAGEGADGSVGDAASTDTGGSVGRGAGAIVLGADTVVAAAGVLYGKALDAGDARRILTVLLHTPHEVITGVTLLDAATGRYETAHAVTWVTMTPMTAEELDAYLASNLWAGKAGAYGIQDHDDKFVQRLEGSFTNVVGLPMELVSQLLGRWGIEPGAGGP
ncbi:MAG TPA: Maf family protein [Phycisphaerae bacterium]|nr:septum formation protein Maf [Phycisphaerales bacterium]HRX86368.1 Maf family protein [Phycisphaerae bacterium]